MHHVSDDADDRQRRPLGIRHRKVLPQGRFSVPVLRHYAFAYQDDRGRVRPVAAIQETALQEKVARFTRAYESARFGKSVDDAQSLPELFKEVTATETADLRKTSNRAAAG